jgi:hypothetical protein
MTDTRKYFYEIFMIVFCVLPITSSLFVSIYLFRLTRQKRTAPANIDGSQVDMPTFKNKVRNLAITHHNLCILVEIAGLYFCDYGVDVVQFAALSDFQFVSHPSI